MEQNSIITNKLCNQAFSLHRYVKIMERLQNKSSIANDKDFQKLFNSFYVVRRNDTWRKYYYELFQNCREQHDNCVTFEYILQNLHTHTGQVEASFASKMLASINPEMPLWDRRVLHYFKKYDLEGSNAQERMHCAIKTHDIIIEKYHDQEQQNFIKIFDNYFPSYPHKISNVKKIDCIIWLLGEDKI